MHKWGLTSIAECCARLLLNLQWKYSRNLHKTTPETAMEVRPFPYTGTVQAHGIQQYSASLMQARRDKDIHPSVTVRRVLRMKSCLSIEMTDACFSNACTTKSSQPRLRRTSRPHNHVSCFCTWSAFQHTAHHPDQVGTFVSLQFWHDPLSQIAFPNVRAPTAMFAQECIPILSMHMTAQS